MSIGGIAGIGSLYQGYSVSSIYANPMSLRPVERIGEEEGKSKPLAVLKKDSQVSEAEMQQAAEKQTMSVAENYKDEMQRMMSGVKFSAESLIQAEFGA